MEQIIIDEQQQQKAYRKNTILTPAQFQVALVLARAYGHLWANCFPSKDVPTGQAHSLAEIYEWSAEDEEGIRVPQVDGDGHVVHTSGSGRLHWEIADNGNTFLQIFRPAGTDRWHPDKSLLVAQVSIENALTSWGENKFEFGNVRVSRLELWDVPWRDREAYRVAGDYLFERHIQALIRPIVALITGEPDIPEEETYKDWRARVIAPAIERARDILTPLIKNSLPDPYEGDEEDAPSVYYTHNRGSGLYWVHNEDEDGEDESFPVESEKTAVNAATRLERDRTLPLVEAIRLAIVDRDYRPQKGRGSEEV